MGEMTDEEFFQRLDGRSFRRFAELVEAANEEAVQNLPAFRIPTLFDMENYLESAIAQGWISRSREGYRVVAPKVQR